MKKNPLSTFHFPLSLHRGQVMIISVLALGGALLGIAGLSGLLMTYEIRQTTDLTNSTKAITAADSGLEWGLYQFFHPSDPPLTTPHTFTLGNNAVVTVNCYGLTVDFSQNPPRASEPLAPDCSNASSVEAVGMSNGASRSLRAYFQVFK